MAAAAAKLLTHPSAGGGVFHLQDASPTQRELWEMVARLADVPMPAVDVCEDDGKGPPDITLDTAELDSVALMWREVPFEEGVRRTIESGTG